MPELISVLTSTSFWWTLVLINCVPYAMIPIGIIFESRFPGYGPNRLPIWKGQSKAFFPGDVGLSLMVTAALQYRGEVIRSSWLEFLIAIGSLAIGVAVFKFARAKLYTPEDYTKGQWNSPTKRWHDFVMFFGFCAVAVYVCLPVYFTFSGWSEYWAVHLLGLTGLVVWALCNVYDMAINPRGIDKVMQHPDTYEPIWPWMRRLAAEWRMYRDA